MSLSYPELERSLRYVAVECSDPYDLFQQVQPFLSDRLPLHNLHWKSATRPLRSIKNLDVNLVKAKDQGPATPATPGNLARRHQIPGLRETPYLKILLFRCDDNETYKTVAKKTAREWMKANSQNPSPSNTQENHDAFEWLILHVVLPNTPAASQPRTTKHSSSGASDSTDNVTGKSKWGRGSSTILDKLKSDFNSSSKNAVDRIAQIRLPKAGASQPPPSLLSPSEIATLWEDLVEKLKTLILASFDLRVSQYEEDIREKDSQRNLPGWNFCTFFVLKEGLAKGFENVGLFEDALAGYDELGVGLDLIVREQASSGGDEHGGSFLPFTDDMQEQARKIITHDRDREPQTDDSMTSESYSLRTESHVFPVSAFKKAYRELILANNISIFDFRSYIFSRQVILLLRASNATYIKSTVDGKSGEGGGLEESFLILAELCHRAAEFIGLGARTLRQDLVCGIEPLSDDVSAATTFDVIDNLVSAWTYAVSLQILTQTFTPALDLPSSSLQHIKNDNHDIVSINTRPPSTNGIRSESHGRSPSRPESQELFTPDSNAPYDPTVSAKSSESRLPLRSAMVKAGTEDFASGRAELVLVARRVLQDLGAQRGWITDWRELGRLTENLDIDHSGLEDISLDSRVDNMKGNRSSRKPIAHGIDQSQLLRAISSKSAFFDCFEYHTEQALRHYLSAKRTKSTERTMADIAILKFRASDYHAAAPYFRYLTPLYAVSSWNAVELTLLELYAECLDRLGQNAERATVVLQLISKCASSGSHHRSQAGKGQLKLYLDSLIGHAAASGTIITASLEDFFEIREVSRTIDHLPNSDGFYLSVLFRSHLGAVLHIQDTATLTLRAVDNSPVTQIVLRSDHPETITSEGLLYKLSTNTTSIGRFAVTQIVLHAGNIRFVYDCGPNVTPQVLQLDETQRDREAREIYVYPASGCLEARLVPCPMINLSETRTIDVEIFSGWNDISTGTVHVRPATAGLRLRVNEGRLVQGEGFQSVEFNHSEGDQNITFSNFGAHSLAHFAIPYSLEHPETVTISAKIEVVYSTPTGEYTYVTYSSISAVLPITVNVQDIFQSQTLFSRFTVGPATLVPLRLEGCSMADSQQHRVIATGHQNWPLDVFPREPASLVYNIESKHSGRPSSRPQLLQLTIDYSRLDDWASKVVEANFTSELMSISDGSLQQIKQPLLLHLQSVFASQWTGHNLELVALLKEIYIPSFEEFQWPALLPAFGETMQSKAEVWLRRWHENNHTIPLSAEPLAKRRIIVPVEILGPEVVLTAGLWVFSKLTKEPAAVGQPIAATLSISHRSRWTKASEGRIEFSYEVFAPPEIWLIGGRRRGSFSTEDKEDIVLPIMLLPQRPGSLLFPALEIKGYRVEKTESEVMPWKKVDVRVEVDYKGHSGSVLVIPDLRETTVAIDVDTGGEGGGRGAWLVGSQRRRLSRS